MAEYKVLGASDRNLKAIEMALSMGGGKSINGEVIPDFHYKEEKVETVKQEIPTAFKLSIVDKGNQQFLRIERGDVTVYATYIHKFYIFYTYDDYGEGHDLIPLSGYFNDNSTHYVDVVLSVQMDARWYHDVETSLFFGTDIHQYPDGPGLKHYVLGTLVRDSQNKWSVNSQNISSDIYIRGCEDKDRPFKIWFNRTGNPLDKSLVSGAFDYNDYQITVFGGNIYGPPGYHYEVSSRDFPLSSRYDSNDIYLKYNYLPIGGTYGIPGGEILTYNELPPDTTSYRKIQIGRYNVSFDGDTNQAVVDQRYSGHLNEGSPDPYLVKISGGDSKPGTLWEKIKSGRGTRIETNTIDDNDVITVNVSGATPLDSQILQQIDQLNGEGYIYFSNGRISLRTPSNNN